MLGFLPGASEQDIIDRELANGDLNSRGTGFADRSGSWNWQDSFGAWMAGSSKEKVLAGARAKRDRQLADKYDPLNKATAASLGPLTANYTGVSGKSESEIKAEQALDTGRATALQQTIANNPDFDATSLSAAATAGDIYGASGKATRARTEGKERTARERIQAETLRQEDRQDGITERMYEREDRKDARAELLRSQEKADALELRRDNMNLEYARMARQDRNDMKDRKDKNIMMLMQGLAGIATGFTVQRLRIIPLSSSF